MATYGLKPARNPVAILCLSIILLVPTASRVSAGPTTDWPGFRGANGDGVSSATNIFDRGGVRLEVAWKRPLGSGYSGVAVAEGRAVTMFSDGKADVVVAFDAADGRELWRYPIDLTYKGHDGSQDGPIPTPLIADGRVFAIGPRGRLFALDAATGKEVWKTDLVAEHGAVKPHWGFGTSPLIAWGVLVVQVGAKGAMVCGFDPQTGRRVWAAGDDAVNYQSPIPYSEDGGPRVLAAGEKKLLCLDPKTGEVLWEYAHEGGGERGAPCLVPVSIDATRVLLKHQDDRSKLVEVADRDGRTVFQSLWESPSIGKTFAVAVHHDGHVYGFNGRTLTCVEAATGQTAWRSREPGDGFCIIVDGHLVVVTKEGGVHVAPAAPQGYQEVAGVKVFDSLCWTPPSFAGGSIFARSFGEIARVDIRPGAGPAPARPKGDSEIAGTRWAEFLDRLREADDKPAAIERFLDSVERFPMVELDGRVIFIYRGPGEDLVLGGDLTGFGSQRRMKRVEGTDLFYCVSRLEPDARVNYAFVRDFQAVPDPLNPRRTTATGFDAEMELCFGNARTELSWVAMPGWKPPTHLDPPEESRRGRIESHTFKSEALGAEVAIDVYTPAGYDQGAEALPVAYIHAGQIARGELRLVEALDNLIGRRVAPILAVFINHDPPFFNADVYAKMAAQELPAFVDARYRTARSRDGRGHVASGLACYGAMHTVLGHPDKAGKLGLQSPFMIGVSYIEPVMKEASRAPLTIYLDWCKYDVRSSLEDWSMPKTGRELDRYFREHGYRPVGGEAHDGSGVASWQNRTDDLLEALFPHRPDH